MSTKRKKLPTKRNPIAPVLENPVFRNRIVPNKHKGRNDPKVEDFE